MNRITHKDRWTDQDIQQTITDEHESLILANIGYTSAANIDSYLGDSIKLPEVQPSYY